MKGKPLTQNTYPAGTGLTYDETKQGGNTLADSGIILGLDNNGNAILPNDGASILGTFDAQLGDQITVGTSAEETIMLQSAADACRVGDPVVAALKGSDKGYVKSPTARTADYVQATEQEWSNGQGKVLEILSNTAGGQVKIRFP